MIFALLALNLVHGSLYMPPKYSYGKLFILLRSNTHNFQNSLLRNTSSLTNSGVLMLTFEVKVQYRNYVSTQTV